MRKSDDQDIRTQDKGRSECQNCRQDINSLQVSSLIVGAETNTSKIFFRPRMLLKGMLYDARTISVGPGAGYDFDAIQAGIDAAIDADMVLVASGGYVITEPITFRGKAVTVQSETGPDETTIRMSPYPNQLYYIGKLGGIFRRWCGVL